VREYVYTPAGALVGTVRQRRQLEPAGARLALVQECWPDPSLSGHPMGRFAGRFDSELSIEGARRRYHGPDVVGGALTIGDGCLWGRGVWPRFGHNFASWSAVLSPELQLTGGRFSRGGEPIAEIVGIAAREGGRDEWPRLEGAGWPGERRFAGRSVRVAPDGAVIEDAPLERRYHARGWAEPGFQLTLEREVAGTRVTGSFAGAPLAGFATLYGVALRAEVVAGPLWRIELVEAHEPTRGHLVSFRHVWREQQLVYLEAARLRAEG
jgi:hypothetical protein